ncbi:MAG: hypothetical protein ACRYFX_19080 [Janthinobacterium lividum]
MTDEQVFPLAQAARAGAITDSEVEAIIDRHHKLEKERILRYVARTVTGADTEGHVITGQRERPRPWPSENKVAV